MTAAATTTVFGIKNCDTMKKAFVWLDAAQVPYRFHDYKKDGIDKGVLAAAIQAHGWENVINKKGTTWRALPEDVRAGMNAARALKAAADNPSLVKRPLIVRGDHTYVGFDAALYQKIFLKK